MDLIAIVLIVVPLIAGFALGWFVGSRPVADWRERHAARDGEARELDEKVKAMVRDLAAMDERVKAAEGLAEELRQTREARHGAERKLASLESEASTREQALEDRYSEREKHFERELARLVEAEEKLQTKFSEIGQKLLDGAQSKFLETAQTRLENLNKESLAELEKKVGPVGETLERYRKRVEEIEKGRAEAWHQLQGVIGEVREGQERVLDGANRLTTTLRGATKERGDWGELQFENLLESCNLRGVTDFRRQCTVDGETGKLRPDAIINIPGGGKLVVDVKNVFNTYEAANRAESDEERSVLLKAHEREVRKQVDDLSAKRYQDVIDGSADFVVMFIPGEHVLYTALSQGGSDERGLLNYALSRRVVLSSPLNFMSIALTIATIWRQAGVQADAEEIGRLGKELYDRIGKVAEHISRMRKGLATANTAFDDLVGSFDKNLRRTAERFDELSVDTSAKELSDLTPLNVVPRRLTNFPDEDAEGTASS